MVAKAPTKRRSGRERGHGEGNIYQRKDGRWRGTLMVGYRADGKADRRYIYGKTHAEARRKLGELQHRQESGMLGNAELPSVRDGVACACVPIDSHRETWELKSAGFRE